MLSKIETIRSEFRALHSQEMLYQKIMEWGKKLPSFEPAWKCEENLVPGCQSMMYLFTQLKGQHLYFYAASDALISAGLAALLIDVYSGEPPETILLTPPDFLEELAIPSALTPGRANGLASLYLKMKQEAVRFLLPGG
jgi:cysteine desulfuration protein SufE